MIGSNRGLWEPIWGLLRVLGFGGSALYSITYAIIMPILLMALLS